MGRGGGGGRLGGRVRVSSVEGWEGLGLRLLPLVLRREVRSWVDCWCGGRRYALSHYTH